MTIPWTVAVVLVVGVAHVIDHVLRRRSIAARDAHVAELAGRITTRAALEDRVAALEDRVAAIERRSAS